MKKIKTETIPYIVLVISLLISCAFIYNIETQKLNLEQERTIYVTNSQVSKLQYIINSLLLKTQTLEMLVIEGNGEVKHFDEICEKLSDNNAIRSLQLAPNGVVTFVYPLKGNEGAFGDLFSDPDRKIEAEYARDSGNMTLAGPYELSQGGLGAVARQPIYLKDENGQSKFWGFSVIVLNFPDAFYPAELDKFSEEGYEYKLHRIDPTTGNVQIIDESSHIPLKNPINVSFDVPNGTWTFSVMPTNGWISSARLINEISISLIVSALIFLLTIAAVELERQRKKMSDLSLKDNLTGLNNQRTLMQTMENLSDSKTPFGFFYFDFDGFKSINDTYGHLCGDLFLIESADRLTKAFKKEASIYRIGGDEFAMIIEQHLSTQFYLQTLEKIAALFSKPFYIENNTIQATVSVGYALYPDDAPDVEELIRIADKSMYDMKNKRKAANA